MRRKLVIWGGLLAIAVAAMAVLLGPGAGVDTAQADEEVDLQNLELEDFEFLNQLENLRTNHNVPLILAYATLVSDGKDDTCEEIGFSNQEANGVDPAKGNLGPLVNLPCQPEGLAEFISAFDPNDGAVHDLDMAVVIFVPAPSFLGTECWDYRAEDGIVKDRTACIEVKDDNTPLIELADDADNDLEPFRAPWDFGVEVGSPGYGGMFISNASADLTLTTSMQDVPGLGLTIKGSPDQIAEALLGLLTAGGDDIKKMNVEVCATIISGDGPGTGDPGQTAAFDLKVWGVRLNPSLFGGNANASGAGVIRLENDDGTNGTFQTVCQVWVLGLHGSALFAPLQVEARKSGNAGGALGTWVASTNGASRIAVVDFIEEGDPEPKVITPELGDLLP